MSKFKGFLKSSYRFVSGFLDAIKGIVQGDLTVKEAYNFDKGSRSYQKKQKEEQERLEIKQMQKDIAEIKKHIEEDEFCM